MLAWKIAPALAAGNTVVLKPAEYTPLTALAFAEICVEAGLPRGRRQYRHRRRRDRRGARRPSGRRQDRLHRLDRGRPRDPQGDRRHGQEAVARARRQVAVRRVRGRRSRQRGRGRRRRDLVQPGPGLLRRLAAAGRRERRRGSLRQAARPHGESEGRRPARQVDRRRRDRRAGAARAHQAADRARAKRRGSSSGAPTIRCPTRGCFYPPTLVTGVEPASILAREEIFGPVLVATTFRTPDEAVALANNTRYGLAASVWTENVNRALEVAARIKAGVVWINSTNLFDAAAGFGGYRESGFGREGGREGLSEYRVADEPQGKPSPAKPARLNASPGLRPGARRSPTPASTAPPSSISAASRRGPTPAIATRFSTRPAVRSGLPASATARTSATPSRRRPRPRPGARRRRTIAPRCSITWRRI